MIILISNNNLPNTSNNNINDSSNDNNNIFSSIKRVSNNNNNNNNNNSNNTNNNNLHKSNNNFHNTSNNNNINNSSNNDSNSFSSIKSVCNNKNKDNNITDTNNNANNNDNSNNIIGTDKTKDSINGTNVIIRRKKPNNNNNNNNNNKNKYNNNNGNNNNNNNNNNNEISSCNKNSTINKDNVISPSPSKISKETVFILGDSIVKKLNGFLLTRKVKHECLVKVRPFSSAKVRCMHDHVKPTIRDVNSGHVILHCGTNDLNSERTISQIARSIIELALSLKSKDNKISVSLIVPRNDNLNNKASEVICRLVHMCAERNIPYIDHTNSIQPKNHLNESKLHFNKYGTIAFANSISKFLSKYY